MGVMTSIRQELRKHRSPTYFTSIGGRKSRTNVETFNDPGGNEMEWEMTHDHNFTSQILKRVRLELQTDWDRGLTAFINRIDAGHQKCLQATTDHIEKTIRRTLEEYLAVGQDEVQSLPLHRESPEPSKSQLLLESAEPDHKAHVEDLTAMLERAQAELENVKSQLKASESRADQLRSIIIPHNEEPILDSEIQRLFSEVRTLTQWVAERLFSNWDKYRELSIIDSAAFHESIAGIPLEGRRDAIHAHLSRLIRRRFFPTKVGDIDIGGKYEDLQKSVVQTEREMMDAVAARHPKGTASF